MIAKTSHTISPDLTAYVEKTSKGVPCSLVVYSERLEDDYDLYVPTNGVWEGCVWEVSARADELDQESAAALEALWDNDEFVAWVDSLLPDVRALPS